MDHLFFKVYRNCYLKNLIYKILGNFKLYGRLEINNITEINSVPKEYHYYIEEIIYNGFGKLDVSKLPRYGNLKRLYLLCCEVIESFKELPLSIESIKYPDGNNVELPKLVPIKSYSGVTFNHIDSIEIPNGCKEISFSTSFNIRLRSGMLPNSLTILNLPRWNNYGNKLEPGVFPDSILTLNIGSYYLEMEGLLPVSLTNLTMSFKNRSIGRIYQELPKSLKSLSILDLKKCHLKQHTFGIGTPFESKLEKLFISSCENVIIELNSIPSSVLELSIENSIIHNIHKGMLPCNLVKLTISTNNKEFKLLNESLPSTLQELNCLEYGLFNNNDIFIESFFPSNLKSIYIGDKFKNLDFNKIPIGKTLFPNSLTSINFGHSFNKAISSSRLFSNKLKSITFGYLFNQKINETTLPHGIEKLVFSTNFNQIIKCGVLPKSLKSITFGNKFNQQILVGTFPPSLTSLVIGAIDKSGKSKFNQNLNESGIFPSLQHLELNCPNSVFPIDLSLLPSSMYSIKLSKNLKC